MMNNTNYELSITGNGIKLQTALEYNDIPYQMVFNTRHMESYFYDIKIDFKTVVFFKKRGIVPRAY